MTRVAELLAMVANAAAPLEERLAAGAALAARGDPRVTAGDRVLVPPGPFVRRRKGAPPRSIELSAYRIDRHPVTVGAYAEFIAAGGYTTARWWSRRGWSWRGRERALAPRFWGEDEWKAYNVPNHPVVGVSVHEAEAYAAFRGARLPTEAEWEKACGGPEGLCHPWGDAWREGASGQRGLVRGTIPIGSFPGDASPFGVRDLVGAVWQWCADVQDEDAEIDGRDPFVDPEPYTDDAPRVTRGGAWNTLPWSICCTSKNGYPPTARFSNLGFRCVVGI